MEFIKKHKKGVIICSIVLLVFVCLFLFLRIFMVDYKKDEYGNRLQDIDKVKISETVISKLETEMKVLDEVENASYRLQGRLIYINLTMKEGVAVDTAKEISNKTLDYFSEKEKAYYDIQVIINCSKDAEGYPFMGYKHKSESGFVW